MRDVSLCGERCECMMTVFVESPRRGSIVMLFCKSLLTVYSDAAMMRRHREQTACRACGAEAG